MFLSSNPCPVCSHYKERGWKEVEADKHFYEGFLGEEVLEDFMSEYRAKGKSLQTAIATTFLRVCRSLLVYLCERDTQIHFN